MDMIQRLTLSQYITLIVFSTFIVRRCWQYSKCANRPAFGTRYMYERYQIECTCLSWLQPSQSASPLGRNDTHARRERYAHCSTTRSNTVAPAIDRQRLYLDIYNDSTEAKARIIIEDMSGQVSDGMTPKCISSRCFCTQASARRKKKGTRSGLVPSAAGSRRVNSSVKLSA